MSYQKAYQDGLQAQAGTVLRLLLNYGHITQAEFDAAHPDVQQATRHLNILLYQHRKLTHCGHCGGKRVTGLCKDEACRTVKRTDAQKKESYKWAKP